MVSAWTATATATAAVSLTTLSLFAPSCAAPEARAIEGDIASVLEKGLAEGDGSFDHRAWDEILRRHLSEDGRRFDYVGLKAEEERLEAYLASLDAAPLATLSGDELFALFINAYNAYTIKTILGEMDADGTFRIESIRDIPEVFDRVEHRVGGFELSLNNIEHNILRPVFRDPRVHFAVNCASISCPPIPAQAVTGDRLDEQLEAATRYPLGLSDYADVVEGELLLTKIMDWYGEDFVNPDFRGSEDSLADFVKRYASDEVRDWIESQTGDIAIAFRTYDWSLNKSRS